MGRIGRGRRGEARLQGHRSARGGDRDDPGAVRSVRAVRVQADGERGQRGTEIADRQNRAGQQPAVLLHTGDDGQVPGVGAVLHGGEHQEGGADGHYRRRRRGRGAHVEHGGRRVLHRAQVRDALAAVRQPGRAVRRHQQRGQRPGGGPVRGVRAGAGRRLPGVRLLQPVHARPGQGAADVPGGAEQHRGGGRVLQVAVASVPGRGAGQAARLSRGEAGQLPARLRPGERVTGGGQPDRVQAAAELAGRAQDAGVDGTVLRAELHARRTGIRADRGRQPVRGGAGAEHRRHAGRVPRPADAQQLQHAGGGRGRGDGRAAGAGRDEDRVQPAGRHGAGQGGPDAHQLLRRGQRLAGSREVRQAGAGHHRAQPGTGVRSERVFQPGQWHAVLVEADARLHTADTQAPGGLSGRRNPKSSTLRPCSPATFTRLPIETHHHFRCDDLMSN